MGNKLAKAKKAGAADASGTPAAPAATADADVAETAEGLESMDLSGFSQGGADEASKLNVDDFELIKVLGKGSFGKVMLCRKKDEGKNGPLYAMKTLRKKELVRRNQLAHTATERQILQTIVHPFLVGIKFAFQTDDKLYMVLEYMGGGELFHWLKAKRKFSEEAAKLFAAEITLALGCLHSHNIIYRDLKPENILLDMDGHLRLTDFGLSKDGIESADGEQGTKTFCGTPEYLAPEILENKGHGKAVDWWSFGTLLYELMCGLPPFYDTNMQRMYHKIASSPLRFPSYLSANSKTILQGLLQRNVRNRLGSQNDMEDVKAQAFFQPLDWDRVMAKDYEPELQPKNLSGGKNAAANAEHFDKEFTNEPALDSVVTSTLSSTQQDKSKFEGFTFNEGTIGEGEEEG
uniref:Protein kinase domain-containing protein n=1 Tax=Florenciella parvula TaxID=236787 RepID=A0A7S2B168_9STRA|mmetsp:Transcript_11881/g.25090  ORF Transcript_11881/g.25090 Transcript_11881/m.25090 type:complete len:405 (+) Transcript_11881:59-1273(+)|eukprot:CAMPEP_0182536444 /NCGR_PEP_ID=MMETSP1323-20130603/20002_1 /TAXON_ID=236787 /ORGANISM="Florenciella parvula, Strain RCC1693" /LENGTH=404 /DNA_ID=CAMNT_0024746681 /DNA_START=50 /DNA_END=1264 /DNA_ORIENTATION=-